MLLDMVASRPRAVADGVTASEEPAPLIGRLADDEFTMFFARMDDAAEVARVGRAVLRALTEPFDLAGTDVSIGIALRPQHGRTLTDLMRAADAAMYHVKASGRGRSEHFSDALAAQIAERAAPESEPREAVEGGQFTLVFQPQVGMAPKGQWGAIVAAEALLR